MDQRDGSRGGKGEWIRETCRLENDGLAMWEDHDLSLEHVQSGESLSPHKGK